MYDGSNVAAARDRSNRTTRTARYDRCECCCPTLMPSVNNPSIYLRHSSAQMPSSASVAADLELPWRACHTRVRRFFSNLKVGSERRRSRWYLRWYLRFFAMRSSWVWRGLRLIPSFLRRRNTRVSGRCVWRDWLSPRQLFSSSHMFCSRIEHKFLTQSSCSACVCQSHSYI